MRRTHGNPRNLTAADRRELRDLGRRLRLGRLGFSLGSGRRHRAAQAAGAGGASLECGARARPHFARSHGPSCFDALGRRARALGQADARRARAPAALLRKSRARPGNLTPAERRDVRRLAAKLDLPTLGRNLAPVARRLRLRPR